MSPRAPLSVGFSALAKIVTIILALAVVAVGAVVALIAYGFAYGERESITSSIGDGVTHRDADGKLVPGPGVQQEIDTVGWIGMIAGGFCSLVLVLLAFYLALRVLRTAAWISGSELSMRGAVRRRSADLATARVSTRKQPNQLVANDLTLNLGSLKDDQLMMLANAISNKRVRSGPSDEAFVTADRLRELARDPFA
ncbi:hypothetical protein Rhe02_23270 [Rhizocola hellebori]|uniref:Uncharacterized protein n=1 Tax=Rhizocola hellebori TaxID=1392758 RepID=A0A8J3Q5K7_9ACTN|nr:hypothetical protein [Rhizocola hellebori]GIH04260.1 hypothetical protein Rhe02_23270 [Rhizocola hellebori]